MPQIPELKQGDATTFKLKIVHSTQPLSWNQRDSTTCKLKKTDTTNPGAEPATTFKFNKSDTTNSSTKGVLQPSNWKKRILQNIELNQRDTKTFKLKKADTTNSGAEPTSTFKLNKGDNTNAWAEPKRYYNLQIEKSGHYNIKGILQPANWKNRTLQNPELYQRDTTTFKLKKSDTTNSGAEPTTTFKLNQGDNTNAWPEPRGPYNCQILKSWH